jgi:hypothetical protein
MLKVLGLRVLVKKERVDCGGLRLTPTIEEDGQKNKGVIIATGQLGVMAWLSGIRKGAKIVFHKHFTANGETEEPLVFVDLDQILGVENVV